jgi:hypothetical protein
MNLDSNLYTINFYICTVAPYRARSKWSPKNENNHVWKSSPEGSVVERKLNRRNRNFLPCGTGTGGTGTGGTVTCQNVKAGTGIVINYGSGTVIIWYYKKSHKHTL